MCGRYVLAQQTKAEQALAVTRLRWLEMQSYNVAPSRDVPVVRFADGEREGVMMRFGLVPAYLNGAAPKFATENARIETMETSPAYRAAWTGSQRCIVPAEGFYQWQMIPNSPKQPWFVGLANKDVMPMAALWERSRRADGVMVESFAIITLPSTILPRMPAILQMEDVETWLTGTPQAARAALRELRADELRAYPVSSRVISPKNDDPTLMDEVVPTAGTIALF